jgi:DNA-binding NtrC family response regulator
LFYWYSILPRKAIFPLYHEGRPKKAEDESEKQEDINAGTMSKVLVVDDELDICLMITKHLRDLQFETQYAQTVKEAYGKLLSSSYDVMFIDLNLTDGSGFDVIEQKNKLNPDAKIIVISAYDSEAPKALQAGANYFIAKPFAIKRINETLRALNFLP